MDVYDLLEADSQLSKLVERAAKGEPFVIAKDGKPLAKVVPVDGNELFDGQPVGFMKGEVQIPDDFDRMGEDEIVCLFEGSATAEGTRDAAVTKPLPFNLAEVQGMTRKMLGDRPGPSVADFLADRHAQTREE